MIFFTVNPIIFGEVFTAKKYVICWKITTYKNMDVKLLHPVWKDFLDTVNTVVLTGYWKQLIIFLFDIHCFFQSGSECGPWIKIIGNSCLVIQKIHLDLLWYFYFQCKSMVEYILVCSLIYIVYRGVLLERCFCYTWPLFGLQTNTSGLSVNIAASKTYQPLLCTRYFFNPSIFFEFVNHYFDFMSIQISTWFLNRNVVNDL